MRSRFTELKDEFAKFVGTFGSWARGKEVQNDERVSELQTDIGKLQSKLEELDTVLKDVLQLLAATIPAAGIIAMYAGPFAPLVMVRPLPRSWAACDAPDTSMAFRRLGALSLLASSCLPLSGSSPPRLVRTHCASGPFVCLNHVRAHSQ